MTNADDAAEELAWRRCETAWMGHLAATRHVVTRLADALNNFGESGAPLMQIVDRLVRAPDLQATKNGRTEFWEVKYRSRAIVDRNTGRREYWISYESFIDYRLVQNSSGAKVWVILHDAEIWAASRKWLRSDVEEIYRAGRRDQRVRADGQVVDAWVWPTGAMTLTDGPDIGRPGDGIPVLVPDDEELPIEQELLARAERELRRSPDSRHPVSDVPLPPGVFDVLLANAQVSLDALRTSLGIPEYPRYSVMRIGLNGIDLQDLLGLMRYGIRVFIVAAEQPPWDTESDWIRACESARLLEWAVSPDADSRSGWIVDGSMSVALGTYLESLDGPGTFNHGQFRIVHESHESDVLVRAGAGTGKTETMAERIMFLLSTCPKHADPRDPDHPFELGPDEIVLITFTREAAREMRGRITRTMLLRQRLCDMCVLPTTAWMLGLAGTEIETIHSYSKRVIQRDGITIGLSPGFSVGDQTMEFRRIIDEVLSRHIDVLLTSSSAKQIPPIHLLRDHAVALWNALAQNGFSPLADLRAGSPGNLDWGVALDGIPGMLSASFEEILHDVAEAFDELCKHNQVIPVSELISAAAQVIVGAGNRLQSRPRYMFVDEFQDTDSEQIGMLLGARAGTDSRLFVVGDEKQGIYRFRGAEGNAFKELKIRSRGIPGVNLTEFGLTRNFRSGSRLLASLHPIFETWGKKDYLQYTPKDRLTAATTHGPGVPLRVDVLSADQIDDRVVETVSDWLKNCPDTDKIAVLCRTNRQAANVRRVLQSEGIPCEIRIGGDFYLSAAVREVRVFLEAILDPDDDAALLELAETRWYPGLVAMNAPGDIITLTEEDKAIWAVPIPSPSSWAERLSSLAAGRSFDRSDLDALRGRVRILARVLQQQPALAWLLYCERKIEPRLCALPGVGDDIDRRRYGKCFDHLVMKIDEGFGSTPISSHRLLEWLRLKIATDRTEDEPFEEQSDSDRMEDAPEDEPGRDGPGEVRVTAVTVHKAKGLEYDRVVIPRTARHLPEEGTERDTAIVSTKKSPRFLWKWKWNEDQPALTNVSDGDQSLWKLENEERIREEARLLYVAMTRARQELVVILSRQKGHNGPESWSDLLREAGLS